MDIAIFVLDAYHMNRGLGAKQVLCCTCLWREHFKIRIAGHHLSWQQYWLHQGKVRRKYDPSLKVCVTAETTTTGNLKMNLERWQVVEEMLILIRFPLGGSSWTGSSPIDLQ